MKKKLKDLAVRLIKNQLVQGSATLFFGSILGNLANYLYHLLMGRMLGPVDYGALESVISLVYFFSVPLAGINLVVVKKISAFRGKNQEERATSFYYFLIQKILWLGFGGVVLLFSVSPIIKNFLHLGSVLPILVIIGFSFISIFSGINISVLSAFLKFFQTSLVGIFSAAIKLVSAALLVSLGFSVLGASGAFLIGSIFGLIFSNFYLKKILKKSEKSKSRFRLKNIIKETAPFFIFTLSFTSLYTTDVILARHFLPAGEAGFYAALAVLSKIIFFACGPIIQVMFPIISARHAAGANYRKLFFLSLGLVFLVCLGVNGTYFLFPQLMVKMLFGSEYLAAAKYLGLFGLFLSLYSLSSLVAQFFLSISSKKVVFLPLLASIVQIVLIVFFHQTLLQIVLISTVVCGLLFVSLMVYFLLTDFFKLYII